MTDSITFTSSNPISEKPRTWLQAVRVGVDAILAVGCTAAWVAMILSNIKPPQEFIWFVFGVTGLTGVLKLLRK